MKVDKYVRDFLQYQFFTGQEFAEDFFVMAG